VQPDAFFTAQGARIAALATARRVPAISSFRTDVEAGGLMSYGPDLVEHYSGAATYVDKILKGSKVGDLPVQRPTKFELVINMKTAKTLGIKFSNSILVQVTKVIE
jgi:putative ABC transport system substrate-binding protein